MKFDFTIINNQDGISIYANKILENIYYKFENELFLFPDTYESDILNKVRYKKISYITLHRLKLGLFDKEFYYSPTHHGPIFNKNKIITIHDIIPLLFKNKSLKQYIYYRYFLPLSLRNTKKIITDSNFTKNMIIKYYKIGNKIDDIIVIPAATDIDKITSIPVYNLPDKYLFFPGVHSEYKNYKRVIEALNYINDNNLFLIITSNNEKIKEYCQNKKNILVMSDLSYGQIKYLYLHSQGLIYPSLIEGFGLPALEAARLKVPIVTTKNSSMHEFLKDGAAIYVNPFSVEDILQAIKKLLSDDLNKMIDIAYENTKNLTWEETTKKIIELIENSYE